MLKKSVSLLLSGLFCFLCAVPAFAQEVQAPPAQRPDEDMSLTDLYQAYENRDFERLHQYMAVLDVPAQSPTIAPRWASGERGKDKDGTLCHQTLTIYGFLWYFGQMQETFGIPLASAGYNLYDAASLITGSYEPDREIASVITGFVGHFYDPEKETNYLHSTVYTAKTNAISHYNQAVTLFRSGDRQAAMEELGKTLHFLQDANEPHHAANKVAGPTSRHEEFEEYASQDLLEKYIDADVYEPDYDPVFYYNYYGCSLGDSLRQAAWSAKAWINCAESTDESLMRICALFTFGNAICHTSGLLYKFAKDVHMI